MKLLGPVIDIYQKQIVQQKILKEIILVEALLVGDQKVLDLKSRDLSDRKRLLAASLRDNNIRQSLLIIDLEELKPGDFLAFRSRLHKLGQGLKYGLLPVVKRSAQKTSACVNHSQLDPRDLLKSRNRRL